MIAIPFVLVVVVLIVSAQILWKLGVSGKIYDIESFVRVAISPLVIGGAILYIIATVIWIFLLSRYQFHLVYPLISLSFVLGLFAARFVLHEEVSSLSWIGVAIITMGVTIASFGLK